MADAFKKPFTVSSSSLSSSAWPGVGWGVLRMREAIPNPQKRFHQHIQTGHFRHRLYRPWPRPTPKSRESARWTQSEPRTRAHPCFGRLPPQAAIALGTAGAFRNQMISGRNTALLLLAHFLACVVVLFVAVACGGNDEVRWHFGIAVRVHATTRGLSEALQ